MVIDPAVKRTGTLPGMSPGSDYRFDSVPEVRQGLRDVRYLADDGIAGVVYLADRLQKPVLIEGPAGTGKTQLAKSVAEFTGARLIRLQCYEGLDESKALYEWNYKKQLLRIQADRQSDGWNDLHDDIFSEEFLLTRPLLEAIRASEPVVLLVDEVDRVEIETEALLLEILSDYQVSIPELGTVSATQIPLVFLTSNNTRELSEALKRRCLYLHERQAAAAQHELTGAASRPRPRQQLGGQERVVARALGHRDRHHERERKEVVVAEPLLAAAHLLELVGYVPVLLDELLVRSGHLVERPQGASELARVTDAADLEVVGRRERQVVLDPDALRLLPHRVVPRVR